MPGHREPAMPSSLLIGVHFEQLIKSQIQQGINSGPGRPVQGAPADWL
jgi:hypothetical protein